MNPELADWLLQQLLSGLATNATTLLISFFTVSVFGLGPIGRGLGARLRGTADQEARRLQAEIDQLNERLDFSERLLHQVRPGMREVTAETTGITTPPTPTPA